MIRALQPWFENIGKRQVKAPKLYFRDSGLFHHLANIKDYTTLANHPQLGTSWEGFALEEIMKAHRLRSEDAFFWAVHQQAELDLLVIKGQDRFGFEFKFTEKPQITRSMKSALDLLNLTRLWIVYPGSVSFRLTEKVSVLNLADALAPNLFVRKTRDMFSDRNDGQ